MLFWSKKRREEKAHKEVLRAAQTYIWSYEDIQDLDELALAVKAGDAERCRELLDDLNRPQSFAACREWLDILVVSISVAMAFRAYFYEPFNIPTGSMQPTLYGNHSVACDPAEATWIDKSPLKWGKWLATGAMYEEFKAPFSGYLQFAPRNDGYYDMFVARDERDVQIYKDSRARGFLSKLFSRDAAATPANPAVVPTDVLRGSAGDAPVDGETPRLPNGIYAGDVVKHGQALWSGYVVTGDFLFVNRWIWNFRHPRRGDVMVFSTTGIENLQQGTHYIKRMTGLPGETLQIKDGTLYADGQIAEGNERIAQIQRREAYSPCEPAYAGYRPSFSANSRFRTPGKTISQNGDAVKLGEGEFYACGDNSRNSFDSRYWGPVPAKNLRGVAGGVFWPISHRWGNVK